MTLSTNHNTSAPTQHAQQSPSTEAPKVTSKTSVLKSLLMQAWRERWTDIEWGIRIKAVLPRGVSGDVHNLADIIIQQATVGLSPNHTILSYLNHSLCAQLISYAAVLLHIAKFQSFDKWYCVECLVDLMESMRKGIHTRSRVEDVILPGSLLASCVWLVRVHHYFALTPTSDIPQLPKKALAVLLGFLTDSFTYSLLFLAHNEGKYLINELNKRFAMIDKLHEPARDDTQLYLKAKYLLGAASNMDISVFKRIESDAEPIDYSLQPLIMVKMNLDPATDAQVFAEQLLKIQKIKVSWEDKGFSNARMYSEILRACFISLSTCSMLLDIDTPQWGAFTFIEMPRIIQKIASLHAENNQITSEDTAKDIVESFELLDEFKILLNMLDSHTGPNNIEYIVDEMVSLNILTESNRDEIIHRRNTSCSVDEEKRETLSTKKSIPDVIINSKPALAVWMKISKPSSLDVVLNILCQFLCDEKIEPILAVASVEGKLQAIVANLITFNECSQTLSTDDPKLALTKSLLFDMTFLILCSIVQKYGSKTVLSDETKDSFFHRWVTNCMITQEESHKAGYALSVANDEDKLTAIMKWIAQPKLDVTNPPLTFDEICMYMPAVMNATLEAWKNDDVTVEEVKSKLDALRSRMCCLPICCVSWLCSYMQTLCESDLEKPQKMVKQLCNRNMIALAPTVDDASSETKMDSNEPGKISPQSNFRERCCLMYQIMRQIQYEVNSPSVVEQTPTLCRWVVSSEPVGQLLEPIWDEIMAKGYLSVQNARMIRKIFYNIQADAFVNFMLKQLLKIRYESDLRKATDILFGLFYLDIDRCTVEVIRAVPNIVNRSEKWVDLLVPQADAFARLLVSCILASSLFNAKTCESTSEEGDEEQEEEEEEEEAEEGEDEDEEKNLEKEEEEEDMEEKNEEDEEKNEEEERKSDVEGVVKSEGDEGDEEMEVDSPLVTVKSEPLDESTPASNETVKTAEEPEEPETYPVRTLVPSTTKQVLTLMLNLLFLTFDEIATQGDALSLDSYFVLRFLEHVVQTKQTKGPNHVDLLEKIPNSVVYNLTKIIPEDISMEFVLYLFDLTSKSGRDCAAKMIYLLRRIQLKRNARVMRPTDMMNDVTVIHELQMPKYSVQMALQRYERNKN